MKSQFSSQSVKQIQNDDGDGTMFVMRTEADLTETEKKSDIWNVNHLSIYRPVPFAYCIVANEYAVPLQIALTPGTTILALFVLYFML